MKAVFLDRDGTINKEVNLLQKAEQLQLISGAAKAIKRLKTAGYLVFIVTNQSVVARGMLTEEQVDKIHKAMLRMLRREDAWIDGVYFCPHHPNADLEEYRKDCQDRKPGIGMIKKILGEYPISLKESYFIGDMTVDIQTGKNAGLKTILLKTGFGGRDKKFVVLPNFTASDLSEAVDIILK